MSASVVPISKPTALIDFPPKILLPSVSLFPPGNGMSNAKGAFYGSTARASGLNLFDLKIAAGKVIILFNMVSRKTVLTDRATEELYLRTKEIQ